MAPSSAIVIVGATRLRSVDSETSGQANAGSACGMPPNRVPMVSTSRRNSATAREPATSITMGPGKRVRNWRPRRIVLDSARSCSAASSSIVVFAAPRLSASSASPPVVIDFGHSHRMARQPVPTATVTGSTAPMLAAMVRRRVKNSSGIAIPSPAKSLTWKSRISTAMPLVKPMTIDMGMKRMSPPRRPRPIASSRTPAAIVHTTRLATP